MQHLLALSALSLTLSTVLASPTCSLVPPKAALVQNPTQGGSSSNSANGADDTIAAGWYAGWHGDEVPPSNVSWSLYSDVKYAFAVTTPDSGVLLAASDQQLLPVFVEEAHKNGVNAHLAVGGWTGSKYFSSAVATSANRTAFVQAIVGLIKQYDLDGVDIDWEYPGAPGIGCNVVSQDDTNNFLLFLQEFRADPTGKDTIVSAAVSIQPWVGPDGTPLTDTSGFAKVLNYIEIMNYDVWGPWSSTVGPNAPLDDSCASVQAGSAKSAVKAWTASGMPANQIVLGVAAYGHSFSVSTSAALSGSTLELYAPFNKAQQPPGDRWDAAAGPDQCGNEQPAGGVFNFWGMVEGGFLTTSGTAAPGIDYRFDNCSQTPFVYNPKTQVEIAFDDATSFAAKGDFINSASLRGFSMWDVDGDYNNILLKAISDAMGIESC